MILNDWGYALSSVCLWLSDNDGAIWLFIRLMLHCITIVSVVSYVSMYRKKIFPTALAILTGGCSGAAFFQGIGEWKHLVFTTQPWVMGLVFVLAVICVKSKGNLSRPFWFMYR